MYPQPQRGYIRVHTRPTPRRARPSLHWTDDDDDGDDDDDDGRRWMAG